VGRDASELRDDERKKEGRRRERRKRTPKTIQKIRSRLTLRPPSKWKAWSIDVELKVAGQRQMVGLTWRKGRSVCYA